MPFLDEQELISLQQEISDANEKKDELEEKLKTKENEISRVKVKSRGINIFFGALAGLAMAVAIFLSKNQAPPELLNLDEIAEIKRTEAQRVIDSLSTVSNIDDTEYEEETEESSSSVDDGIQAIKNTLKNEKIYSIQVGVFTKNKFPLLSESIAGITSQGEYFKHSFGLFKTLEEAQGFRRNLVKIGFKDAFIASYINGERQKIEKPY